MDRRIVLQQIGLALAGLAIAALACSETAPKVSGEPPKVTILSPKAGSSVLLNKALAVEVSADDPEGPGVTRLDLQLDGMVIDTFEAAAPEPELMVSMECTPVEEGALMVTVIAYREDGTRSEPASIALSVVPAEEETTAEEDAASEPAPAPAQEPAAVQARATGDADILERPGEGCRVIGRVPRDEVIDLLRRTTSTPARYYQTNFLGEDDLGWVDNEWLTLMDEDDQLPRDPEATCLFCGDGTCSASADENCGTCADDCGYCSAGAPPVAPGACQAGPGACCGDGICQTDEDGAWCGDCPASEAASGSGDDGDGKDKDKDKDKDDDDGFFNDFVKDLVACGDGQCKDGETQESCPEDCGVPGGGSWGIADDVCGNGKVESGEECDPPGSWCGRDLVGTEAVDFYCTDSCTCPN